ncbi:hypothetical protein [Luteibacter sp.]|uniref:hypothetical protein n=1 Tax=Luteibacter sp. TaxID=1886636 RepID=UPI003F7FD54C
MLVVFGLQIFCLLVFLLQLLGCWPDRLWATGWLLGLPGSELGQWTAERLLWKRLSGWPVGLLGASLMVVINLSLAYAAGMSTRLLYRKLYRRSASKTPLM